MMKLAYRKGYYLKHPKKFFSEIVVNLRWNWQRKKRGYSDADLWSLDVFMLGKMIEWLKAFRSHMLHSYPADFEGGYDGWLKTLDEMIENLECGKYVINPDEHIPCADTTRGHHGNIREGSFKRFHVCRTSIAGIPGKS